MKKGQIITVYKCQGYDRYVKNEDLYMVAVNVSVIAEGESEALAKAATLLEKPNWRIIEVYQLVVG